jgi:hypothetical protein
MIRVEVPGSSFMLCLGPGPPSLLHLTRANAEKPYAGDTKINTLIEKYKKDGSGRILLMKKKALVEVTKKQNP